MNEAGRNSAALRCPQFRRALVLTAVILLIIHLLLLFLRYVFHLPGSWGPGLLFHFGGRPVIEEQANAPIWFLSLLALLTAALLGLISSRARRRGSRSAAGWRALSWLFVVLSIDAMTMTAARLADRLGTTPSAARWAPAVLAFAIVSTTLAFLHSVRAPHTARLRIGLGIYLMGSIGIDLSNAATIGDEGSLAQELILTVTRLLEVSGLVLAVHALVEHLERTPPVIVGIRREQVRFVLITIMGALILGHVAALLINIDRGFAWESGLALLVSLNAESNLPTWFSTTLLLACAAVLFPIAIEHERPGALSWWSLAILFVGLSLDEAASFHERLIQPLRSLFHIEGGPLYYAWVIVAIPAVALLGLLYTRLLLGLPPPYRTRFLVAASLFLGGAVGMELVGGALDSAFGTGERVAYQLVVIIEEGLEMSGLIVFLDALLGYAAELRSTVYLRRLHLAFGGLIRKT